MARTNKSHQAAQWLAANGGKILGAATLFGVTSQAVSWAWKKLYGDTKVPRERDRDARRERIAELANGKMTTGQIAADVGLSRQQVYTVLVDLGLITKVARDADISKPDRIQAALAAIQSGVSVVDAAIDHNVGRDAIEREMRRLGIRAKTDLRGRRDGRIARAIARVDHGTEPARAAELERCSASGLYKALRERRKLALAAQAPESVRAA